MNYIEVSIHYHTEDPWYDLISDDLASIGFEAFEVREGSLHAYIKKDLFHLKGIESTETLTSLKNEVHLSYREIEQRNWNEEWEANYNPISVDDVVYIRAPFHEKKMNHKIDILIQPKMSFGTGHHETTQLMVSLMLSLEMRGKGVLDMGSGTGVLAILAEKLGAQNVTAIDTDPWAVENSLENIKLNHGVNISVQLGSTEKIENEFDIILANINTNILLDHRTKYYKSLIPGGSIVLSGFLKKDERAIEDAYTQLGLACLRSRTIKDWCGMIFIKME